MNSVEGHSEPSWFKDIKFDDSDTEQIADEGEDNLASEFQLSRVLNLSSFLLSLVLQDIVVEPRLALLVLCVHGAVRI